MNSNPEQTVISVAIEGPQVQEFFTSRANLESLPPNDAAFALREHLEFLQMKATRSLGFLSPEQVAAQQEEIKQAVYAAHTELRTDAEDAAALAYDQPAPQDDLAGLAAREDASVPEETVLNHEALDPAKFELGALTVRNSLRRVAETFSEGTFSIQGVTECVESALWSEVKGDTSALPAEPEVTKSQLRRALRKLISALAASGSKNAKFTLENAVNLLRQELIYVLKSDEESLEAFGPLLEENK